MDGMLSCISNHAHPVVFSVGGKILRAVGIEVIGKYRATLFGSRDGKRPNACKHVRYDVLRFEHLH